MRNQENYIGHSSRAEKYDVVIVGGGMVGATLAAALGQATTYRIAVLEREALPAGVPDALSVPSTFDTRSIALSRSTVRFLYQMGWWTQLRKCATAIRQLWVETLSLPGCVQMCAEQVDLPALGYVVPNVLLGQYLIQTVRQCGRVTVYDQAVLHNLQPKKGGFVAQAVCAGESVSLVAPLWVVADGVNSQTLNALGIESRTHSYAQNAVITTVRAPKLRGDGAYEFFQIGGGSLAFLPLSHGRHGLVWALPAVRAEAVLSLSDEDCLEALTATLGQHRAPLEDLGQRSYYPLQLSLAREQIRPHCVVLGNAAHSLHPIAGQGFNLAVRDVMTLVNLLKVRPERLSCFTLLQRYEELRLQDQNRIVRFCQGLLDVFSWREISVVGLRQLAMLLFDCSPQAQAWLAKTVIAPTVLETAWELGV